MAITVRANHGWEYIVDKYFINGCDLAVAGWDAAMRVIAGKAKGTRLFVPKGLEIRPTLDRVRESLFGILSPRLPGARFLDLFAGTGANGIEALSRGATLSTFVDSDARALAVVRKNLELSHFTELAKCLKLFLPNDLGLIEGEQDIVFADPPYSFAEYSALLEDLSNRGLVARDGVVVVEHDRRVAVPMAAGGLSSARQKRFGDTLLTFYS